MNATIETLLEYKGQQVYSLPSNTPVLEAVREMIKHNIGSLVVMDRGRLVGMFTPRDLMRNIVAKEKDYRTARLSDAMKTDFPLLTKNMDAEQTMEIFEYHHIRHLPVVEDGLVVGVISIGDLSRWCSTAHRAEEESIANYIHTGLNL
jgi:CBS domain-containing protein